MAKRTPRSRTAWSRLQKATPSLAPAKRKSMIEFTMNDHGIERDEAAAMVDGFLDRETWMNRDLTITVTRNDAGDVSVLSIRRNDRADGPFPWRWLQAAKNEIAGDEVEAFEIFPAESRVVDTANQRWLWVMPPGTLLPVGFNEGRRIADADEVAAMGAVQAPLDPAIHPEA